MLTTTRRPAPGTHEYDLYRHLLGQMVRAGVNVVANLDGATRLAETIQDRGHRSDEAVTLAADLGLDPRWLPHRRDW